eukprot:6183098-Pleurochrysis_carterae.AAC.2
MASASSLSKREKSLKSFSREICASSAGARRLTTWTISGSDSVGGGAAASGVLAPAPGTALFPPLPAKAPPVPCFVPGAVACAVELAATPVPPVTVTSGSPCFSIFAVRSSRIHCTSSALSCATHERTTAMTTAVFATPHPVRNHSSARCIQRTGLWPKR